MFSAVPVVFLGHFVIIRVHPFLDSPAEIGGFLGLLLGASVLTIVEVMDVLMLNAVEKWKVKSNPKAAWI